MSLAVTGTQYLVNSTTPLTTVPITVGAWVRSTSANSSYKAVWNLGVATNTDRFALYQSGGNKWMALITAASTDDLTCEAGTVTANVWMFMVARFITSTNRRIGVLSNDGSTAHVQSTVSSAPAAADRISIGAIPDGTEPFAGQIAEIWYTNTDIQVDNAQLQDSLLRQLAYGGPFSVPHVADDILEYRSFRKHPFRNEVGEVYFGGKGAQIWAPTSTPTVGFHPPLPYWYIKPGQRKTELTI